MLVKVAGQTGFCFGVKRAINIAEKTLKEASQGKGIYSFGPIIHNPQVVDALSKKGLRVIKDIKNLGKGTVIVCSHGAPKSVIEKIKKMGSRVIDATCPFVKYAQDIVSDLKKQEYKIIIIGDKQHPEVKALLSIAENRGTAQNVTRNRAKKIGIVSQTTQNKGDYLAAICQILKQDFREARIFNTICSDTSRRQALTRRLLSQCDVMIVVGGKNSANTRRLWQICKESGVGSYHIETDAELKREYFRGKRCAGVVSGASTPDSMVKKVVKKIEELS